MKKIIVLLVTFCLLFTSNIYADTNTNVNGGGSNGGTNNVTGSYNILGSMDDERNVGIRVTLVDANTGKQIKTPIDFANNHRKPVKVHFGKINKLKYINGIGLKPIMNANSPYQAKVPKVKLPKIIGGDMKVIKDYFGDETIIKEIISKEIGIPYEEIISINKDGKDKGKGKYKLLLEPIGYPLIKGKVVACTSTELAMYNTVLNGAIRHSDIMNFSHDNLPLSMFLEHSDLGIKAWTGKDKGRQSDVNIKEFLGVGIVSFDRKVEEKPKPPKPPNTIDYTYHEDTNVITSIPFSRYNNPLNRDRTPKAYVKFEFNPIDRIHTLTSTRVDGMKMASNGTIYPFVKWRTPKLDETEEERVIQIEVETGLPEPKKYDDNGNPVGQKKENTLINVKITKIKESPPPNPLPDDRSWNGNKPNSIDYPNYTPYTINDPQNYKKMDTNKWTSYEVIEDVKYDKKNRPSYSYRWNEYNYTATLILEPNIHPSNTVKTRKKRNGNQFTEWEMKSAYGIDQYTTATVEIMCEYELEQKKGKSIKGERYESTYNWATKTQGGVSFFSDFNFADGFGGLDKTYWRLLEDCNIDNKGEKIRYNERMLMIDDRDTSVMQFKHNHYSTYKNRTHFTPIWYPDNREYTVTTYVFDAFTPVGMLTNNGEDSVHIQGNMWDDYYVQLLPDDYED